MDFGRLLLDLMAASIATAGFGLMFRTKMRMLIPGAVIGGLGYVVYDVIFWSGGSATVASFAAALLVGVTAELAARMLKSPTIVFATMGIIPLVPGAWLYRTMEHVIEADYASATAVGLETLMIAGAIALALGCSTVMARTILRR